MGKKDDTQLELSDATPWTSGSRDDRRPVQTTAFLSTPRPRRSPVNVLYRAPNLSRAADEDDNHDDISFISVDDFTKTWVNGGPNRGPKPLYTVVIICIAVLSCVLFFSLYHHGWSDEKIKVGPTRTPLSHDKHKVTNGVNLNTFGMDKEGIIQPGEKIDNNLMPDDKIDTEYDYEEGDYASATDPAVLDEISSFDRERGENSVLKSNVPLMKNILKKHF